MPLSYVTDRQEKGPGGIKYFGENRMAAIQPDRVQPWNKDVVEHRPDWGLGPEGMPGSRPVGWTPGRARGGINLDAGGGRRRSGVDVRGAQGGRKARIGGFYWDGQQVRPMPAEAAGPTAEEQAAALQDRSWEMETRDWMRSERAMKLQDFMQKARAEAETAARSGEKHSLDVAQGMQKFQMDRTQFSWNVDDRQRTESRRVLAGIAEEAMTFGSVSPAALEQLHRAGYPHRLRQVSVDPDGSLLVTTEDGRTGRISRQAQMGLLEEAGGKLREGPSAGVTDFRLLYESTAREMAAADTWLREQGPAADPETRAQYQRARDEAWARARLYREQADQAAGISPDAIRAGADQRASMGTAEAVQKYDQVLQRATKTGLLKSRKVGGREREDLDAAWGIMGLPAEYAPHRRNESSGAARDTVVVIVPGSPPEVVKKAAYQRRKNELPAGTIVL